MTTDHARAAGAIQASRACAQLLAASVLAISIIVLVVGWGLGVEVLTRLRGSYAAMMPSTATSLALLAFGLLWEQRSPRRSALAAWILAGGVVVVAIADLAIMALDLGNGVDIFLPGPAGARTTDAMSPATAVCALLASAALVSLARLRHGGEARLLVPAATIGLLLSLVAVVGYAYDAQALYRVSAFTALALHTAVCFAAIFTSLLLSGGQRGWVGVLLGPESGSAGARRLLPIVVAAPFVLGLLTLLATRSGLLSANFRLSLLAIATMAVLAATVLRNAALENRANRELAATAAALAVAVDDKQLLLREVYHRVKNNLQQINALLHMESRALADGGARAAFQAVSGRILALGAVHTLMVAAAQPSRLNVDDFLADLCATIAHNLPGEAPQVRLTLETRDRTIDVDSAVTLGLLLNELVAMAASELEESGEPIVVDVSYSVATDGEVYSVSHAGARLGRAGGAAPRIAAGLARQLGGSLSASGATALARFPTPA